MKNIFFFLCAIMTLLCTSCVEEIELDLNKGDNLKLVVDAWLNNSARQQVINLSLSSDYFDAETPGQATGASITVSSDRKTYGFTESDPGVYLMNETFDGQPSETFTLDIEYDGKRYTATQQMMRISKLDNINYVLYDEFDEENHDKIQNPDKHDEWDVYASFQEPVGEGDNYFFASFNKESGPEKNLYLGQYYQDVLLDGAYIDDEYVTYGYYEPGDTIVTQMFSITEEVHDYLLAIDEQTAFRGFVFDTPPANVPTNISNDGKGYFIISAVSEFEKVLEL